MHSASKSLQVLWRKGLRRRRGTLHQLRTDLKIHETLVTAMQNQPSRGAVATQVAAQISDGEKS